MTRRTLWILYLSVLALAAWFLLGHVIYASPELPIKGLNGTGIGYCVSVYDEADHLLGIVDVPYHVVDPEQRKARGYPALDIREFDASVRNAAHLVAPQATIQTYVCATTYRDSKGNVLGCMGACGDCVKVKVHQPKG